LSIIPEAGEYLLDGEKLSVAGCIGVIDQGRGLSWGTDAWLLASSVKKTKRVCELGCGCGIVSLLIAGYKKSADVVSVELRKESADAARRGCIINSLGDNVKILCRDIRGLKYTDPDVGGRFDTVVANPPYIAHPGTRGEDSIADDARHENHGGIDDFCLAASRLLNYRGSFICVFRPARLADLFSAMRKASLEPKRMRLVYPDVSSAPSLVICEATLGGAPGLDLLPPFIIYKSADAGSKREYTGEAAYVYENCAFPSK